MNLRTVRLKPKTLLWWTLLLVIVLFSWAPVQRILAVAALQNTLERAWEISFNIGDRPQQLPEWLDTKIRTSLTKHFSEPSTLTTRTFTPAYNRDVLYRERYRAPFRGPIHTIEIWYPQNFRGDVGAALKAFPSLRRLMVFEDENFTTEADWILLLKRLRELPNLEDIELAGETITDAAISHLAHHPGLKTVAITFGALTPASTATFATLPHLTHLRLKNQGRQGLSPEDKQKIREALPKLHIEFQ